MARPLTTLRTRLRLASDLIRAGRVAIPAVREAWHETRRMAHEMDRCAAAIEGAGSRTPSIPPERLAELAVLPDVLFWMRPTPTTPNPDTRNPMHPDMITTTFDMQTDTTQECTATITLASSQADLRLDEASARRVEDTERTVLSRILRDSEYSKALGFELPTTLAEVRAAFHARDGHRLAWLLAGVGEQTDPDTFAYLAQMLARPEDRATLARLIAPHLVLGQVCNDQIAPVELSGIDFEHGRNGRHEIAKLDHFSRYTPVAGEPVAFYVAAPGLDETRRVLDCPQGWFPAEVAIRTWGYPDAQTRKRWIADELLRVTENPVALHRGRCTTYIPQRGEHVSRYAFFETMRADTRLAFLIALAHERLLIDPATAEGMACEARIREYLRIQGECIISAHDWTSMADYFSSIDPLTPINPDTHHVPPLAEALAGILEVGVTRRHTGRWAHNAQRLRDVFASLMSCYRPVYDRETEAATSRLAIHHTEAFLALIGQPVAAPPKVTTSTPPKVNPSCELRIARPGSAVATHDGEVRKAAWNRDEGHLRLEAIVSRLADGQLFGVELPTGCQISIQRPHESSLVLGVILVGGDQDPKRPDLQHVVLEVVSPTIGTIEAVRALFL